MMADIDVKMGEIMISGRSGDNLTASGIGSCLVITLYDPLNRIGALAHTMLSSTNNETVNSPEPDTRYINIAIDAMLKEMQTLGARRQNLEAKLIGGANMFASCRSNIGKDNISDAREKLKEKGISVVGETVGGSQGRSVGFSPASGIVTVKVKF